jgi:hypothetical protein
MIFLIFIPCKLHFVGESCKEDVRGRGHNVGKGTGTEHKPNRWLGKILLLVYRYPADITINFYLLY